MIRDFYRQLGHFNDDVRRGVIRSSLFAAAMLLVSCRGGVAADDVDTGVSASGRLPFTAAVTAAPAAATPTAAATTSAPSFLGVNVAAPTYWTGEQQFQNLLIGSRWQSAGLQYAESDPSLFDKSGNIVRIPAGGLAKVITPPAAAWAGNTTTIRCTWSGTGRVGINGDARRTNEVAGDHSIEFRWIAKSGNLWVSVDESSSTDPVRNLDCREKGATGVFAPEFIASLKPFGTLRFMDWMQTNTNVPVTWATRTSPEDLAQSNVKGAALEHIVALTNEVGADAWVNVPWNADADYVRRMAQLLHDGIAANHKIYVELSNEVWNTAFPAQHQAESEGVAAGLSTDRFQASMFRYSQKTSEVMKVWTAVFADRPGQLVRVAASFADVGWVSQQILSFGDTVQWVDALAIAPYFGANLFQGAMATVTDADMLYPVISEKAQTSISLAVENKAIAQQYGKRLIAYEAGQHILGSAAEDKLDARLNRDQRMYNIYRTYIAAWKAQVGDVMMMYSSTGYLWGLRENQGQTLAETPKLRAVLDAIAAK